MIPSGQKKNNLMPNSLEQFITWGPACFDIKQMMHFLFLQPGAATSVQRNGGTLGQGRQCSKPHKFIKLCIFVWCLSCSTRSGYLCNTVQHGSRDCMYIFLAKFDCLVSRKWIFETQKSTLFYENLISGNCLIVNKKASCNNRVI